MSVLFSHRTQRERRKNRLSTTNHTPEHERRYSASNNHTYKCIITIQYTHSKNHYEKFDFDYDTSGITVRYIVSTCAGKKICFQPTKKDSFPFTHDKISLVPNCNYDLVAHHQTSSPLFFVFFYLPQKKKKCFFFYHSPFSNSLPLK